MGHKHTRPTHYRYEHIMSRRSNRQKHGNPSPEKDYTMAMIIMGIIVVAGLILYVYVWSK